MDTAPRTLAARVLPDVVRPGSAAAGGVVAKGFELLTLGLLATLVPRLLGPEVYGRFAVVLAVVMIGTTVFALGGTPLMSRFVPAAPRHQRPALARALGLRLAVSRAGQLAAVVAGGVGLALVAPEAFPAVATGLALAALIGNVLATLALQVGLGLGRTGPWNARYPVQNAVLVAAVVVLFPVMGETGALLAIVAAAACALGVGAVALGGVGGAEGPAPELPDGALRFGRRQGAGWALTQLTQRGAVLAVALLAGSSAQTGFAALAIGIALPALYAVLRLFTVSLPGLAEHADHRVAGGGPGRPDQAEVGRAEARLRRLAGAVLAVLLPAAAVAALLVDRAVPVVFGSHYAAAAAAFVPALGMVVLGPVTALVIQSAALRVRPEASLWSALGGAAVFLAVSAVAVPSSGAAGGTAAALAGMAVAAAGAARMLPGAVGARLGGASAVGTLAVVALGVVA